MAHKIIKLSITLSLDKTLRQFNGKLLYSLQGKAIGYPFTKSLDKNLHQFKCYIITKRLKFMKQPTIIEFLHQT